MRLCPVRIRYFSPYDILRGRTNQISDVRLCEGFAEHGCDVEMISTYVFRRDNLPRETALRSLGVTTPFRTTIMPTPLWDGAPPRYAVPLLVLFAALFTARMLLSSLRTKTPLIVMSRSIDMLIPAILMRRIPGFGKRVKIICWLHEITRKRRYLWVYRHATGLVGTNSSITDDLPAITGRSKADMAISLNPISTAHFANRVSRADARQTLGITATAPIIVYTGKLYIGQREAEFLIEAARRLPNFQFLLTGGKQNVIEHYRAWCKDHDISNVRFTGFLRDAAAVQLHQFAADVLVSYYTTQDHDVRYNLPNKMCEYMLSGAPIVTADYPATRDILNAGNAIFVEPNNVESLVDGIRRAAGNPEVSMRLAARALEDVREMTFFNRCDKLLRFFRDLPARQ